MSFSGTVLKERNEKIVKCISDLKHQRNELNYLIDRQQEEKSKLETEIRRITYKLGLINKSVSRRIVTRDDYDKTIKEAEESYERIVESSGALLDTVLKTAEQLECSMDKKIGTDSSYLAESSQKTNEEQKRESSLASDEYKPAEGDGEINDFSYFSLTKVL